LIIINYQSSIINYVKYKISIIKYQYIIRYRSIAVAISSFFALVRGAKYIAGKYIASERHRWERGVALAQTVLVNMISPEARIEIAAALAGDAAPLFKFKRVVAICKARKSS